MYLECTVNCMATVVRGDSLPPTSVLLLQLHWYLPGHHQHLHQDPVHYDEQQLEEEVEGQEGEGCEPHLPHLTVLYIHVLLLELAAFDSVF